MELSHLSYFIPVAEELGFSRAAERLNVSQPPLSRQIRGLESELNVKLINRNRHEVNMRSNLRESDVPCWSERENS
jgi:DNA-binding transcriptional LysR family regulator